jgi:ATP-dependent Lon protease
MKIINTGIHDTDFKNINKSKLNLSNKIIENIFPLLEDIKSSKSDQLESLRYDLLRKTKKIKKEKYELEGMINKYRKHKKIKNLLERISKIVNAGLTNSGSYKHENIVLLKVIDTLSEDQLNYHLSETLKTINRRFRVLL